MSVWKQLIFAYAVRIFLIWTALSLLLLVTRHINRRVVSFVTEFYTTTFDTAILVFAVCYFPRFTCAFMGVCWVILFLSGMAEASGLAAPKAPTPEA
ncbi:hypothetical protein F4859DRAFT_462153 [Xylaria cf. heliscus]|nr:hypothetical protein F4859DRAFT_462153 [Xylaria cf. heliscus]